MEQKKEKLTLEERQEIEKLLNAGYSYNQIAKEMDRSAFAIRYEIRRCNGSKNYKAEEAHEIAITIVNEKRTFGNPRGGEITFENRKTIEEGIKSLLTFRAIGKLINRSENTVKNEVRKLGIRTNYTAEKAQERRDQANANRSLSLKKLISQDQIEIIREGLANGWTLRRIRFAAQISWLRLQSWIAEHPEEVEKAKFKLITTQDRLSSIELQLEILLQMMKEKK